MWAYSACIRRATGGVGIKTALRPGTLFMEDTRAANVGTFFTKWPRHLTTYLCFGRTAKAELREKSRAALMIAPRRLSTQLAVPGQAAADSLRTISRSNPPGTYQRETLTPKPRTIMMALPKLETLPAATPPPKKVNLHQLRLKYDRAQPISMVTAYDYSSARIVDASGADVILVGDSVGMVVLGHEDTTEVTMEDMVHHCRATARGTSRALLVCDLPFGSYLSPYEAVHNGVRLVKEGRADAVKLEGGERVLPQVRELIAAGVAVMGHVGLTPQSYAALGGYRVQGRTADEAMQLLRDCLALQEAGCFAIVMEMVPGSVAELITSHLSVPTIGIGAGVGTSGQVQVYHDLLGLYDKKTPKFARQFDRLEGPMVRAISAYVHAVQHRTFPQSAHTFPVADGELSLFRDGLEARAGALAANGAISGQGSAAVNGSALLNGAAAVKGTAMVKRAAVVNGATTVDGLASVGDSGSLDCLYGPAVHVAVPAAGPVVIGSIAEWRELRRSGALPRELGLVPTMGALHEGHLSLVRLSKSESTCTAVSIFVNPRQFAAHEDLGTYPRTWEADLEKLARVGADFVFAPEAANMYPPDRSPRLMPFVDLVGADELGEGGARPGFFRGVGTVLTKLLNITQPSNIYMGQKDGMQCLVTRRLLTDLDYDVRLVVGPTVREDDGLAMSSRNVYLSAAEREVASLVYGALQAVELSYYQGERSIPRLQTVAVDLIRSAPSMSFEYLSFIDTHTCEELGGRGEALRDTSQRKRGLPHMYENAGGALEGHALDKSVLVSIAVKLGTTRLIDNVILQ